MGIMGDALDRCVRERKERAKAKLTLRPEVLAFAMLMEEKLWARDYRPGWKLENFKSKEDQLDILTNCLLTEVSELAGAIVEGIQEDIVDELRDIGNFAMMVADAYGGLDINGAKDTIKEL